MTRAGLRGNIVLSFFTLNTKPIPCSRGRTNGQGWGWVGLTVPIRWSDFSFSTLNTRPFPLLPRTDQRAGGRGWVGLTVPILWSDEGRDGRRSGRTPYVGLHFWSGEGPDGRRSGRTTNVGRLFSKSKLMKSVRPRRFVSHVGVERLFPEILDLAPLCRQVYVVRVGDARSHFAAVGAPQKRLKSARTT